MKMYLTEQVGGWNIYKFQQWASDPNLMVTSQQDAIDHPEKYPYNTAAGSAKRQDLGTAVFKDLNGDRQIDENDMIPSGYTIIPEMTSFCLSVLNMQVLIYRQRLRHI